MRYLIFEVYERHENEPRPLVFAVGPFPPKLDIGERDSGASQFRKSFQRTVDTLNFKRGVIGTPEEMRVAVSDIEVQPFEAHVPERALERELGVRIEDWHKFHPAAA